MQAARPRWKDEPEAKGIPIEVETHLEDIPPIRGGTSGLHDIFINLIFNALDAMPKGGKITIHTQLIEEDVQISVSDTGIGMNEETRLRVFEPFFTTKMDVGSGLGLSTAHNTVTRWGGNMVVGSELGAGTNFTLRLPVWTESEIEEETVKAGKVRPGKILVVEDDENVSELLSHLLSRLHEVETASDGRKALEAFGPGLYEVAMIDLGLPGLPGDQVEREMRSVDPCLATVLITGWELREDDPRQSAFDFQIQKTLLSRHWALRRLSSGYITVTGHRPYLDFCTRESMGRPGRIRSMPLREWDQPLVMAKELGDPGWLGDESDSTKLERVPNNICHMYRFLSRCAMQLRLHRIDPDKKLLAMSQRVLDGMTRYTRGGMVVTGTVSMAEGWHETQDGRGALGETCATVHLVHLMDELLRLEGDLHYGDIMERAIFNALFAAQSPDGRRLRYYTSFSGPRTYTELDTYCCPGNFRRGIGALPSFVYYRQDNGFAINLYGHSTATVDLGDDRQLVVRQETDYPTSGRVLIRIEPSVCGELLRASAGARLVFPGTGRPQWRARGGCWQRSFG